MPQAWYIDDAKEDTQSEHHSNPPQYINIEDLHSLSGVEYWEVDVDDLQNDENLKTIRKIRGYDVEDQIEIAREKMPNYDEVIEMFYREHEHEEDECRLFLDGYGYFDVRDKTDRWIRIKVERGVLLVLPAGTYHRYTPGVDNYKVMRLYCNDHVWKAIERQNVSKSCKAALS